MGSAVSSSTEKEAEAAAAAEKEEAEAAAAKKALCGKKACCDCGAVHKNHSTLSGAA